MCLKLMVSDVNIIVNCSSVNFFVGGGLGGVRIRGSRICFHFQKKKKGAGLFLKNCLGYLFKCVFSFVFLRIFK